ncbi:hypothetical protein SLS54_004898 [Diplodia seriata]
MASISKSEIDIDTAADTYVNRNMQAAVLGGALDRPLDPPIYCKTGNCIWPELITLGVCSRCPDITGHVNETCQTYGYQDKHDEWFSSAHCTMTAPSGLVVEQTIVQNHTSDNANGIKDKWIQFVSNRDRPMTDIYSYTNYIYPNVFLTRNLSCHDIVGRGDISRHFFLKDVGGLNSSKRFQPSRQYTECTLYWCSLSYSNFRIRNGTVEEGSVTSAPLRVEDIPNVRLVDGERTTVNLTAPETLPGNSSFHANLADMSSMSDLIQLTLADFQLFNIHSMAYASDYYFNLGNAMSKSANLSQTMANVAKSMTNAIRQSANATIVHGQAFRDETYMRVRWAWFALPASLVFLTAFILIAAVRINSRNKVMLWKSSMLPLLFHGLDTSVDAPPRQKLSQVDARARMAKAKLHVTERNDFRFVLS